MYMILCDVNEFLKAVEGLGPRTSRTLKCFKFEIVINQCDAQDRCCLLRDSGFKQAGI